MFIQEIAVQIKNYSGFERQLLPGIGEKRLDGAPVGRRGGLLEGAAVDLIQHVGLQLPEVFRLSSPRSSGSSFSTSHFSNRRSQ